MKFFRNLPDKKERTALAALFFAAVSVFAYRFVLASPEDAISLLSLALGLGGGVPVVDLVFIAVGVLIACQDGVAHKSRRWWRNAWYAMRNGFAIGLVIALLFLLMSSCSASALTAAPRGGAGGLNA